MNDWSYDKAFSRNLGLITLAEQARLRQAKVAIAGMGGVGGIHLVTLTRLGIGNFTICDPDTFSMENSNRQYGAVVSNYGKNKAEVMAGIARDINPEVNITIIPGKVTAENAKQFLAGADLFVDGFDAFSLDIRRVIYREAAEQGIYAVSAGPFGFSTGWMIFAPQGMSFDSYFDFREHMTEAEKFIAFIVGIAPGGTHLKYIDKSQVNFKEQRGPSASLACDLAAGVIGVEALKILLKRGSFKPVPHYQQFDPYLGKFVQGSVMFGNRHPIQRLKRWYLMRYAKRHQMLPEDPDTSQKQG